MKKMKPKNYTKSKNEYVIGEIRRNIYFILRC